MTGYCEMQLEVERWARLGAHASLPVALERHAAACLSCAAILKEITAVRQLVRGLPEPNLDPRRVDEIRFALQASARQAQRQQGVGDKAPPRASGPQPGRSKFALRDLGLVVAKRWRAVGLASTALLVALLLFQSENYPPPRTHLARITLQAGASGRAEQPGPHEVYRLNRGSASFSVQALGEQQSFRVVVGEDSVEVRGTTFDVQAVADRLERVVVREGEVLVRVAGRQVTVVPPGGVWQRSATASADVAHDVRDPVASGSSPTPAHSAAAGSSLPVEVASPPRSAPAAREGFASVRGPGGVQVGQVGGSAGGPGADRAARPASAEFDAAFRRAWQLLRSGGANQAATAFDALSREPALDAGRRSDALYWAAQAYRQAGHTPEARSRAEQVTADAPQGWHAAHAALLVGETLIQQGDHAAARVWLDRALKTGRADVKRRAASLLAQLPVE